MARHMGSSQVSIKEVDGDSGVLMESLKKDRTAVE